MHIDSFSGAAADLPVHQRTPENVLQALGRSPRVSCWDMEAQWLRTCLSTLERQGFVKEDKAEPYPWLRYNVTEAGRAAIRGSEK